MPRFDTRQVASFAEDVATLAGSLVHEIKNPLSTLNVNAQLLLEEFGRVDSPREQRIVKRLEVMVSEVRRIEEIVNTFHRYAQPQPAQLEPASLNDLLGELWRKLREEMERKRIHFRFSPDLELPPVRIDPALIYQALLNLVQNAEQAMPDGGELIVRSRRTAEHAEVEVIDTGPGIPEEQLPLIFRPYFSTKSGGSGLGLSITLRIIRAHSGELSVESERGKGSRFVITLPLVPDPTAAPQAA